MLVLSRKCNESVVVGGIGEIKRLVKVTVLALRGGKVELGFEVDQEISVHRSEVFDRIRAGSGSQGIESGDANRNASVQ